MFFLKQVAFAMVYFVCVGHSSWALPTQCFDKHELIDTIDGSSLLPKEVCFEKLTAGLDPGGQRTLFIQGQPIAGEFLLEPLIENENITKMMTYIFSRDHQTETGSVTRVTLRLSVDFLRGTDTIDYIYLAAEFFVPRQDGEVDTHISYYKRIKNQKIESVGF